MAGFAITPLSKESEIKNLKEGFYKRRFTVLKEVRTTAHHVMYAPKFNGKDSFYQDTEGNFLFYCGTMWFNNKQIEGLEETIIADFRNKKLNLHSLSGTFTLVIGNQDVIQIIHDTYAVNRFYIDTQNRIISSSWLSLAWNRSVNNREINLDALKEHFLLGFNLGVKTWIKGIERVTNQKPLDKNIRYQRATPEYSKLPEMKNRHKAVDFSISVLHQKINDKLKSFNSSVLGLSSGYDSRLVTSAINKNNRNKLDFFTFHKPGDKDPEIAKKIANNFQKQLRIERTNIDEKDLEIIFNNSFLFFDGQCATLMQYSKEDYTLEFRQKIFKKQELHLSGVGGEIFRNYANDHNFSLGFKFWINHYFNGGRIKTNIQENFYKDTIKEIHKKVESVLKIKSNRISYKDRRLFYSQIWLSDWYGLRNTIENQYMNYYSPFTEPEIINLSSSITKYIGLEGQFEAEMIRKLSPVLASFNSEYGHDFIKIPFSILFKCWIAGIVKTPFFSSIRRIKSKKRSSILLTDFEKSIINHLTEVIDIPQSELNRLLETKREQILATAYILYKLNHENHPLP